jgi:hypothetical protein
VGRKSRRAEDVATSVEQTAPDLSRAVGVNARRCTRVQIAGFVRASIDATCTERLKSGAESLLHMACLGRAEIFALPRRFHHQALQLHQRGETS